MAGIISLIDWKGNVCDVRKYFYKVQRHDIIEMWGKVYGENFYRCTMSILPEIINPDAINDLGRNMRFKKLTKKAEINRRTRSKNIFVIKKSRYKAISK